jgi:hypothetical protein
LKPTTVEHATLQILAGSVRNVATSFLVEQRSRRLSKSTIWYYILHFKNLLRQSGLQKVGGQSIDTIFDAGWGRIIGNGK